MTWRITDPGHLLGAVRVSLARGGHFLVSRIAPNGPILREPSLSYVHKASWGMYAAGVDHDVIARLLDWVQKETLRENRDFYVPSEPPGYKDMQRVYRAATFGKVAAWIDHPVIRQPGVVDRILQYQHKPSGGVFNYIGEDPSHVEQQPVIGSLNTTFFGHLMIALGMRDEALGAGEWVRTWIHANRDHLADGRLYTQRTPDGRLVTEIAPGERIGKLLDTERPKQEFWHVGTAMAYLAVLYDVMLTEWNEAEQKARPYLDAALELLDFESRMPLDTYLWPSKCKVGWGVGELMRVLVQQGLGDEETLETAYRAAERVATFTFMDNQLPGGGWPGMHYPLSDRIPEADYSYKPLAGTVWVPPEPTGNPQTIFIPPEEITGEFLGEMQSIEQGVAAWLMATGATT
jgi:hypothetical protein